MARPQLCPTVPLISEEHRVAVTPMATGYRIGSTMEFAGYDTSIDGRRLDILRRGAGHFLREPLGAPLEEEWFGWRPMTPDGKPILDRSPQLPNVVLAVGHNMLGLSMAPATGKLVAEMLAGHEPHLPLAPYAVGRF
jgi:D-amino-acid dehydrogenase